MKKIFLVVAIGVFVLFPFVVKAELDIAFETGGLHTEAFWRGGGSFTECSDDLPEYRQGQTSWFVAAWARTNEIKLPWKLEPTLRLFYCNSLHYDWRDWRHPLLNISPKMVGGSLGLTRSYKNFDFFLLMGVSWVGNYQSQFIELRQTDTGKVYGLRHGGDDQIRSIKPVLTLGAAYLFDLGPVKIGPAIGIDIYPSPHGIDRCREFGMGYVQPFVSIITWFKIF